MTYSRVDWCKALLTKIGNSNPTSGIINWLDGWTVVESTPPGAMYNLLNTTQRMPGSTDFNSVGVQNFTSFDQGVSANSIVLHNGYYPNLLHALQTNGEYQLGITNHTGPNAIISQELKTWCGGCNYINTIIQVSGEDMQDQFPGSMPAVDPIYNTDAIKEWQAVITSCRYPTGIFNWWYTHWTQGMNYGPPLTNEFSYHGGVAQVFPNGQYEWPTRYVPYS